MTGSNASLGAYPGWSLYAGSKAVQQAWARVWLNELRDRKIRVNVLTPGQVATAKQEELFDEATKAAFESLIPRGQMGRPEEIATVALFLALQLWAGTVGFLADNRRVCRVQCNRTRRR
jgi:NAD(P)-dependent dehydrogenase (short-subunit alcohol dehydrogenase family)